MFNYNATLQSMRRERASMQAEVEKLDQAIAALQALAGDGALSRTKPGRSAQAKKVRKVKRKISREGLQNIIDAQSVQKSQTGPVLKSCSTPTQHGFASMFTFCSPS
jgi:hypothetical protein